jgi:ribA/ribD-fused uncharacterized protein
MESSIKTGVINQFRGEYYFLSNYYTSEFRWRHHNFSTAEQAFAFAKTFVAEPAAQESFQRGILRSSTPGEAKKLGRSVPLTDVSVWDSMRVQYMREIVHAKFEHVDGLAGKLLNTGAMMLVEGNTWGDDFWGRCLKNGKMVGSNHLGVILMEERGYWLHHEFGE